MKVLRRRGEITGWLATLYTVGFLGLLVLLIFAPLPDENHDIIVTLASIMATAQAGIIRYYFPSSKNDEPRQEQPDRRDAA